MELTSLMVTILNQKHLKTLNWQILKKWFKNNVGSNRERIVNIKSRVM